MAKALRSLMSVKSKILHGNAAKLCTFSTLQNSALQSYPKVLANSAVHTPSPRAHSTLSAAVTDEQKRRLFQVSSGATQKTQVLSLSTEVDKEISKFLDKEIQYEKSRSTGNLPPIPDFEIATNDADLTLTKKFGSEKITIRFTVNGAVDSVVPDVQSGQAEEPPQMVCRPPFEVELNKGDGTILALQCTFPAVDDTIEDTGQHNLQNEDQFEIQEVAIHTGEWKDTTYSVSAATMDAELFDLLMDMLDERGINDEFIAQLVDYCTAYESQKYVNFLGNLKNFAEK